MDLAERKYADVKVLAPQGRIDHRTADEFQEALSPCLATCTGDGCKLVLDLGGVDYMSSVGLRVLMMAAKQVRGQNGRFVVAGLGETLREIFQISRFDRIFDVYATVREALEALSEDALAAYGAGGTDA